MTGIQAVCFDYGNTLVEFGAAQFAGQRAALEALMRAEFGRCDPARLKTIRDAEIMAPFRNGCRENDLRALARDLVTGLYAVEPDERLIAAIIEIRRASFVADVKLPAGVGELLARLKRRYRLGLLSNYPCVPSIRGSLERLGLLSLFDAVVVSAEIGFVKPDPRPFQALLARLALPAAACVYVGDNWLADVQGAKRLGLRAVLTTEYVSYERFAPAPGDLPPDATIARLADLEAWLDGGAPA